MARTKRSSSVLETARQRLAGLKSISPAPDFGASLTLAGYSTDIDAVGAMLNTYNQQISGLDQLQIQLEAAESALRDKNKRFLSAAEANYGADSSEYEQAGGKRSSERKQRSPRKPTTGSPTP